MTNIDQDFVEYVVKSLVNNPDEVSIERKIDEKGVLLTLSVDPEDLGRVIGKRGATAQSLRTLLRALGTKNDARYNLKIADDGSPKPPKRDDSDSASTSSAVDDATSGDGSWGADENNPAPSTSDDTPAKEAEGESAIEKAKKELAELDDLDI